MGNADFPAGFSGESPLFPLPDTVLFPGQVLPLHVFEARYRAMVRAASSGEKLIAMAVLKPGWEKDYEGRPPIHPVVGLGRIEKTVPLADGRYNILLRGLCRAEVLAETAGAFRTGRLDLWAEDPLPASAEPALHGQLREVCRLLREQGRVTRETLNALSDSAEPLGRQCDRVASLAPLTEGEKRELLETRAPVRRLELLLWALGKRLRGFVSYEESATRH